MCVSNKAIELQAIHFYEKIRENSVYKIVRVNLIGGRFIGGDQEILLKNQDFEDLPLIKNLILQANDGKQFSVEPDELGLQFAKGDLSYKQYVLAKKQTSRTMIGYTLGFTVVFTTMAGAFINHFL